MKNRMPFLLALLALLVAVPAFGQNRQPSVKFHTVLGIASDPPGLPVNGDRYLVGKSPSADWAGHSGDLATWNGVSWILKTVESPDQVYDSGAGAIYAKTDTPSQVNLWNGSKFVRLSGGFAKLKPTDTAQGDLYIDSSYADTVITSSPNSPATFVLANPIVDSNVFGISLRVEKYPGQLAGLTIDVEAGGTLCDSNLNIVSPLTIAAVDGREMELRAGGSTSHCTWYLR
jgi:hypothetical protein